MKKQLSILTNLKKTELILMKIKSELQDNRKTIRKKKKTTIIINL